MEVICKKCGEVDNYSTSQSGPHVRADCKGCGSFIKFLPQTFITELKMPIGKFSGQKVTDIKDAQYLKWFILNVSGIKGQLKEAITNQINNL